jgi:hypothetical protein
MTRDIPSGGHIFNDATTNGNVLRCENQFWYSTVRVKTETVRGGVKYVIMNDKAGPICGVTWNEHQENPQPCVHSAGPWLTMEAKNLEDSRIYARKMHNAAGAARRARKRNRGI